jgi:hypothetical protein
LVQGIELLRATGILCDDTMEKHFGRLSKALKDRLDGRNEPVLVQTNVVVNETGLPEYWVVNAIHSHLIRYCQQRRDVEWVPDDDNESVILVPVDFGHPL